MSVSVILKGVEKSFEVPVERNVYARFLLKPKKLSKNVLSNLSFDFFPGERVLLLGPNGRGKTTLLKIIAGFSQCSGGEVYVDGVPIRDYPSQHIGFMLGTQLLYSALTGYENLEYSAHLSGLTDIESSIESAINRWELREFIDFPTSMYSNGMKVRLALARATLALPTLICLDEPTAHLDEKGIDALRRYLRFAEATVFIASQGADSLGGLVDRVVPL